MGDAAPVEICVASAPAQIKHGEQYGHLQSQFGYYVDTRIDPNTEEIDEVQEKQECGIELMKKQRGSGAENFSLQKPSQRTWVQGQGKIHGTSDDDDDDDDDDDRVMISHTDVDADASSTQLGKLSVCSSEEKLCEEGQVQFCFAKNGTQTKSSHGASEQTEDEQRQKQSIPTTPPVRKQAGWSAHEEPEFVMEESSWPTLAEARNAKFTRLRSLQERSLQPHSSASFEEAASISLLPQRVSSSQTNLQERSGEISKHTNANTSAPGEKYKSLYKKGGYSKSSFTATENLPLRPMGVHVPSANMFIPDHSVKGNRLVGMNKYFLGPHQAPAHGPFYYPRAESLAAFAYNSAVLPTYGRGHPGWQHNGRGYGDANYKHTGFIPPYDQHHLGPRHIRPLVAPFMNMNVEHHIYPSYQSDMPYVQGAPASPSLNSGTPYFRPSGPSGVMMQQAPVDLPKIQEMLQKQIEYYFSTENLCHDTFLTSKMDEEGFVPLSLIASFPRVRSLTWDTILILEAMKNSTIVELRNGKLRSHEWRRWKPFPSGTSRIQGNPLGLLNHNGAENVRNQERGEVEESLQGHLGNISSVSGRGMIAGSCVAPWTGVPANVGAISVPMVTSIDSR